MITVSPILYAATPSAWHALAEAVGLVPAFPPDATWSEFVADGGLAVHGVAPDDPLSGTTDLHFLVDDLAATETSLVAAGFTAEHTPLDDVGDMLTVVIGSGARVTLTQPSSPPPAPTGPLAVLPIWYQPDLAEPRRLLEALGLRARLSADAGVWMDFVADGGGLVGLHRDEHVSFELSFEYSADLDALAERLTTAGYAAAVVDEAYNRTLRVATPDRSDLFVNGRQDDLYGYTRHDGAPA